MKQRYHKKNDENGSQTQTAVPRNPEKVRKHRVCFGGVCGGLGPRSDLISEIVAIY